MHHKNACTIHSWNIKYKRYQHLMPSLLHCYECILTENVAIEKSNNNKKDKSNSPAVFFFSFWSPLALRLQSATKKISANCNVDTSKRIKMNGERGEKERERDTEKTVSWQICYALIFGMLAETEILFSFSFRCFEKHKLRNAIDNNGREKRTIDQMKDSNIRGWKMWARHGICKNEK